MLDCLVYQCFRLLPGSVSAKQRDEGHLALLFVLAQSLSDSRFITKIIEEVVGDLEREPKALRVSAEAGALFERSLAEDRAGFNRPADERACLEPL